MSIVFYHNNYFLSLISYDNLLAFLFDSKRFLKHQTSKTKILISSYPLIFSALLLMLVVGSVMSLQFPSAFAQGHDDSQLSGVIKDASAGDIDIVKSSPVQGSRIAPITIIEFGDYQCPECQEWFQNEKPLIKSKYIDKNKVKFYFVDYAYLGPNSINAANASYCAAEQGKYWEYHSYLYELQKDIDGEWVSPISLKWFASNVGESNGISAAPVFFIIDDSDDSNDSTKRIDGPQPHSMFAEMIDKMLEDSWIPSSADNAISDTESLLEDRLNVNINENGENKRGGGCLIATATYGSELATKVQQLRELRDNRLLQTESGTSFMNTFNDVYYSFSPVIADYERENPAFKEMVKIVITPMISSLSLLNYVDMNSESEVLGYGISLIILNLVMYIGIPASVIVGIQRKFC